MAIPHGRYYMIGKDRRAILSEDLYRAFAGADYDPPTANALTTAFASEYAGGSSGFAFRPFCLASAPFSKDNLGQTFPSGTLWVITNIPAASLSATNLRGTGVTTNPLTGGVSTSTTTGFALDYVYIALGIPSGASGSITIKGATSGTTYATFTVTPNGTTYYYEVPTITPGSTDTSLSVVSNWTGGVPRSEGIALHPVCQGAFQAVAVPSSLPAGFTARLVSDQYRGGTFDRRCGYHGKRRLQAGAYQTFETYGYALGGDPAGVFGVPSVNGTGVWVGGILYAHPYQSQAIGQQTFSASSAYIAGGGSPSPGSFSSWGVRYCQVSFTYQKFSADPQPGDTITWTVTQDGTTIGSGTVTGSGIKSIPTQTLTTTLPAYGTSTTIQVSMSGSAGTAFAWECTATVAGSPRCDIPLLYTCVGPGNIAAPGGYLPSVLTAPTNNQPLTRLASGVTSHAFTSAGNLAFVPASTGWWQVLVSSTPQQHIGEDEFGWADKRTVRRGRSGRPFHAMWGGGSGTLTLTAYSPPAPTAIAGTGTSCTQASDSWGVWCSVTFPTTATYRVYFTLASANIVSGLVAEWSGTDATVVDPPEMNRAVWEPYAEAGSTSFQNAILNTPPSSPGNNYSWIVGTSPTGAWAGHANCIACWDFLSGAWIFRTPVAGSYMNATYWFDGSAWHSNGTDPQLTLVFNATSGQTVYFFLSPMSTEVGSPAAITVGFATP